MYKVYIDNKTVIFSDVPVREDRSYELRLGPNEDITTAKLLQNLQFTKYLNVISDQIDLVFDKFCASQPLIEAAGGVAYNSRNEVLLIYRKDRWDLPKGKLEEGEQIEKCALREVEEECSVSGLVLDRFITHTYHCYKIDHKLVLKRTWWYVMTTTRDEKPVPQIAEGIIRAEWIPSEQVPSLLKETYGNIRDVFRALGTYEL